MRRRWPDEGFTLVELLAACAVAATLALVAVPAVSAAVEGSRTRQAAHYLAAQLEAARSLALARSAAVALVFGADAQGAAWAVHVDGNGNGVRTAEVRSGVDPAVTSPLRLDALFTGVRLADGTASGVRLGATRILSFSPLGTATPGSLIVSGPASRYALRITGGSGRVRLQRFIPGTGTWSDR